MGVLYVIAGIAFAGIVSDLVLFASGDSKVGNYEYHFAPGVGAVFGER